MNKKKALLILRGGVSKVAGKWDGQSNQPYINYKAVCNSIKKHIINANSQYVFDVYIHCWDVALQEDLIALYQPIAYKFELNNIYHDDINYKLDNLEMPKDSGMFRVTSNTLSLKKAIELVEQNVQSTNTKYDACIISRPDIMYFTPMDLNRYNLNQSIYVNTLTQCDYHFVMNYKNLCKFKFLYDSFSPFNIPGGHKYIQEFVRMWIQTDYKADYFKTPYDLEILRKLARKTVIYKIDIQQLLEFGVDAQEFKTYVA